MKGYSYLDLDGNIVYKPWDYITNQNPGFFSDNRDYVLKYWKFDTDDFTSMRIMLMSFTDLGLRITSVDNFLKSIGLTLGNIKDYTL